MIIRTRILYGAYWLGGSLALISQSVFFVASCIFALGLLAVRKQLHALEKKQLREAVTAAMNKEYLKRARTSDELRG